MPIVLSTREGLVGDKTASGYVIDTIVSFAALPSTKALHKWVSIQNLANGIVTIAQILDVGPWNTNDENYVFGDQRPLSESGQHIDSTGKIVQGETNGSGIDLGERVWKDLGMTDNGQVSWNFIEPQSFSGTT
jgi:hypothetical protein